MSGIPRDFDNKSLYKDVKSAIEYDKLYWIRNEAKIRACYTSGSYDEFRETVAAAHLCPLEKKDNIQRDALRKWNSIAEPTKLE